MKSPWMNAKIRHLTANGRIMLPLPLKTPETELKYRVAAKNPLNLQADLRPESLPN